jgi:hypothetical protein
MYPKVFSLHALLVLLNDFSYAIIPESPQRPITRRDAFLLTGTTAATLASTLGNANAAETIDMDAINAARAKTPTSIGEIIGIDNSKKEEIDMDKINAARSKSSSPLKSSKTIIPISDPGPLLAIRGGQRGKSLIKIPRVGYSFYKTPPDQAARATSLAIRTGIQHFDVGKLYNSNEEIAKSLKKYLDVGMKGLVMVDEKPELLELLDATRSASEKKFVSTLSSGTTLATSPAPDGSAGRGARREKLFISHKISNAEQSTDPVSVRRSAKRAIASLGCQYLDMISIHSPLTDSDRRLESYKALLNLRDSGFVKVSYIINQELALRTLYSLKNFWCSLSFST